MTIVTSDLSSSGGYPRKRARTRRQLINAGMAVLADKGPAGTTVGEIARTAKMATGTFYNHFPSVPDLVDTVTGELATGVAIGRETLDQIANDPALRVLLGTGQLLDLAEDDPVSARAFVRLLSSVPTFRGRVRDVAAGAVNDGMQTGRFATWSLDATTDALLGAVVQWMRSILAEEDQADVTRKDRFAIVLSLLGVDRSEFAEIIEQSEAIASGS